jgi:hypothetical protein
MASDLGWLAVGLLVLTLAFLRIALDGGAS